MQARQILAGEGSDSASLNLPTISRESSRNPTTQRPSTRAHATNFPGRTYSIAPHQLTGAPAPRDLSLSAFGQTSHATVVRSSVVARRHSDSARRPQPAPRRRPEAQKRLHRDDGGAASPLGSPPSLSVQSRVRKRSRPSSAPAQSPPETGQARPGAVVGAGVDSGKDEFPSGLGAMGASARLDQLAEVAWQRLTHPERPAWVATSDPALVTAARPNISPDTTTPVYNGEEGPVAGVRSRFSASVGLEQQVLNAELRGESGSAPATAPPSGIRLRMATSTLLDRVNERGSPVLVGQTAGCGTGLVSMVACGETRAEPDGSDAASPSASTSPTVSSRGDELATFIFEADTQLGRSQRRRDVVAVSSAGRAPVWNPSCMEPDEDLVVPNTAPDRHHLVYCGGRWHFVGNEANTLLNAAQESGLFVVTVTLAVDGEPAAEFGVHLVAMVAVARHTKTRMSLRWTDAETGLSVQPRQLHDGRGTRVLNALAAPSITSVAAGIEPCQGQGSHDRETPTRTSKRPRVSRSACDTETAGLEDVELRGQLQSFIMQAPSGPSRDQRRKDVDAAIATASRPTFSLPRAVETLRHDVSHDAPSTRPSTPGVAHPLPRRSQGVLPSKTQPPPSRPATVAAVEASPAGGVARKPSRPPHVTTRPMRGRVGGSATSVGAVSGRRVDIERRPMLERFISAVPAGELRVQRRRDVNAAVVKMSEPGFTVEQAVQDLIRQLGPDTPLSMPCGALDYRHMVFLHGIWRYVDPQANLLLNLMRSCGVTFVHAVLSFHDMAPTRFVFNVSKCLAIEQDTNLALSLGWTDPHSGKLLVPRHILCGVDATPTERGGRGLPAADVWTPREEALLGSAFPPNPPAPAAWAPSASTATAAAGVSQSTPRPGHMTMDGSTGLGSRLVSAPARLNPRTGPRAAPRSDPSATAATRVQQAAGGLHVQAPAPGAGAGSGSGSGSGHGTGSGSGAGAGAAATANRLRGTRARTPARVRRATFRGVGSGGVRPIGTAQLAAQGSLGRPLHLHWQAPVWRPTLGHRTDTVLTPVPAASEEYGAVLGPGGIGSGIRRRGRVLSLDRVDLPDYWQAGYERHKQYLTQVLAGGPREVYAWHGSSLSALRSICNSGFSLRPEPTHGRAYGHGIYLAAHHNVRMAMRYAIGEPTAGSGTVAHVLLCTVLCGQWELARPTMYQASPGCHTGVDNLGLPNQLVVWSAHMNDRICPRYLIQFRQRTTEELVADPGAV